MSSLMDSLNAVTKVMYKLHDQIATANVHLYDQYLQLLENMGSLLARKKLITAYIVEMTERIEEINAEMDNRIEDGFVSEDNGERKQRVADVKREFEEKVAELPVLEILTEIIPECEDQSNSDKTVKVVFACIQKFGDHLKNIPNKKHFFYAAAFSSLNDFLKIKNDKDVRYFANSLWLKADLLYDTRIPLTLDMIDRIIHLPSYKEYCFVILDTSLQVILTNARYGTQEYQHIIIYDSGSHKCAPVFNEKFLFCQKCFRYPQSRPHTCERQCPICLRVGDDVQCCKSSAASTAYFCRKCRAYCQTSGCFAAHRAICPRPVSGLHDDVLQLLKSQDI